MNTNHVLVAALLALAAPLGASAQDRGVLQRFDTATAWLNSPPLHAHELHGKVVLVDFWTYTCIYWIRTLPHVRAWAGKYKDRGLVVIGVHTPEFEFEKNIDNVRRAVDDMRVAYPVAIDSDYSVWRAFGNSAWPAVYLVDAQGRVRYRHLGEGEYERTEKVIQQLLAEAGKTAIGGDLVAVQGHGVEAAADWASLRSPETYVGAERTENFASPGGPVVGKPRAYAAPARLAANHWALAGDWTMHKHAIALNKPGGRIVYRFHARDLHLVMGPAARGAVVRFRVLVDGKAPAAAHGIDIDAQGNGRVTEQRLYQLIRQPQPVVDRQFEIEFLDPGVEAFAFTFG
jgi:thiol-disulfide isomerase/thioredoxin